MPGLAIVGEAPGEQEELLGRPFVGPAGRELDSWLRLADINRADCFLTNVFKQRPPANNLEAWCVSKADAGPSYPLPPLRTGKYLPVERAVPALADLRSELSAFAPTVVLALGNTALWALCGRSGIGSVRGTVLPSTLAPGIKVLPTYHPAAVLRDFPLGVLAVRDVQKAKRELAFPEIRRPERTIFIPESVEDVLGWNFIPGAPLSWDIETAPKLELLLCLAISDSPARALVIPFTDRSKPDGSFWSAEDEFKIWRWLQRIGNSHAAKLGQNLIYDAQWLVKHGVWLRNWRLDTMIGHHSLYSELPKGLDNLGSYYTDERAWKQDRPRGQHTHKREE